MQVVRAVALILSLAWAAFAQSSTSTIYARFFLSNSSLGRSSIFADVRALGLQNHVIEWTVTGAPAGCTLLIESSDDLSSWSTASTQTCTSSGSVALTSTTYNFLTANLSALVGGSSPAITVVYRGYLAGQGLPVRQTEGGTGSLTTLTAGSVVFQGSSSNYQQDNANFFWNDASNRLCLLGNSCSNSFDIAAGKFFVTSLGRATGAAINAASDGAANVPNTVQGAAAQSANLTEWKNSAGTVLASISSAGAAATKSLTANATSAATVGATVKGYAAQSANLQNWTDSADVVLASISAAGALASKSSTSQATAADVVAATIQGAAAQTAALTEWKNSGGSVLASVTAAGVVTPTSGMNFTGRSKYSTVPVGSVAYGSFGTNTTPVAGTIYWAEVFIPRNMTITGVGVLNGDTVGTDEWIVALYASAGGAVLANSALAGVTSSGANAFQEIPFTGTYAAVGPGRYWIAFQTNGTTDRFRTVAASTFIDVLTTSAAGAFGTLTALTPPTTFTNDVGPIAYVY